MKVPGYSSLVWHLFCGGGLSATRAGSLSNMCSLKMYFSRSTGLGIPSWILSKFHEVSVDWLSPLFPRETCSNMPPLQPRDDMILHNVHLGEYGSVGESTSIVIEEGVDVLFCEFLYSIKTWCVTLSELFTRLDDGWVSDKIGIVPFVALGKQFKCFSERHTNSFSFLLNCRIFSHLC